MTTVIQALANLKTAIEAGDTNTALENLSELTALGNLSELTALGDLSELTALGDLSELTALGDIATIKSTLSSWQPYLKYLQYLVDISNQTSGQNNIVPGTFESDEEYLSEKCICANWIYDALVNAFVMIDSKLEAASLLTTGGLIGIFELAVGSVIGSASLPILIVSAIPGIAIGVYAAGTYNASYCLSGIQAAKTEIITALYNSITLNRSLLPYVIPGVQASNISWSAIEAIEEEYSSISGGEKQLIGIILDYFVPNLFQTSDKWPTAWQDGPPAGSISCGDSDYTTAYLFEEGVVVSDDISSSCVIDDSLIEINEGFSATLSLQTASVRITATGTAEPTDHIINLSFDGESGACESDLLEVTLPITNALLTGSVCRYLLSIQTSSLGLVKFDYLKIEVSS